MAKTGSERPMKRRELLRAACRYTPALLVSSLTPRRMLPMWGQPNSTATLPRKIIITGGHPGDPEYGCGGTIARLTPMGHDVVLLYLNDGGWPPTPSSLRMAEAARACSVLKARPAYAGQANGHAIVDEAHYTAFREILLREKPDAVFTHWPIDNHRDHRAIANLTYDAWAESKHAFALYYYEVSDGEDTQQFAPTRFVDISAVEAQKRAACFAHASQSPDHYYPLQDAVAKFRGLESGFTRAEAFVAQQQNSFDLFSATGLESH